MIGELIGVAVGTTFIVAPTCLYAGARLRERIPIRVPTNKSRIADAETDLRLLEISRERRQVDFNIERDALVAEDELANAREKIADRERQALALTEGENHRVLEARLLDAARAAFPDASWGSVGDADGLLALLGSSIQTLRQSESAARVRHAELTDALYRARWQLPKYLRDACVQAGLL